MTKRITVSVPDDLFDEIEAWKQDMNVSGEFQACIKRAIEKRKNYSEKLKGATSMQETIERLKREKKESSGGAHVKEHGKTSGLEWAKTAHYDELVFVYDWYKGISDERGASILDTTYALKNFSTTESDSLFEYFDELFSNDFPNGWENTGIDSFLEAWLDAVFDFYLEIKDKI